MKPMPQPSRGILFLLLAALCWSTAGFFTRLIALDPWTILFWRGAFGAVMTGACALYMSAGTPATAVRFRRAHWPILFWMTLGTLAFIPALALTSVASVAIIYATMPLIVAGLARIWLGERVRAITIAAGLIAIGGVAVMGSDRAAAISGAGLALAFAMAFSMAMTTVAFRKHPDAGCWPIGCLSNVLTAVLSLFLAQPFAVSPPDLLYLLLFSLVQMTLGLGLFVMGTRRIAAADAALVGLIEAPLAPLWVWLAFDETPSGRTLAGGALVLAAAASHVLAHHIVAGHIAASRERRAIAAGASGRRTISS